MIVKVKQYQKLYVKRKKKVLLASVGIKHLIDQIRSGQPILMDDDQINKYITMHFDNSQNVYNCNQKTIIYKSTSLL